MNSKMIYFFIAVLLTMNVEAAENSTERSLVEPRGHGKYALLTHLAFLLAAKAGFYKIVLGIALVIASMKAMVVMAWALAIFKYAPDVWPTYKHADITYHGYDKYHSSVQERPIHFFYVVVTKLVVLKIVYGIIFFVLLSKAWHFVLWFIHYLKEKKRDKYIEIDHDFGHHDFGHHDFGHHDFGHHDFGHHDYGHHDYGHPDFGHHDHGHHGHYNHEPYKDDGYGSFDKDEHYPQKKKGVYDADGSYSVKGST